MEALKSEEITDDAWLKEWTEPENPKVKIEKIDTTETKVKQDRDACLDYSDEKVENSGTAEDSLSSKVKPDGNFNTRRPRLKVDRIVERLCRGAPVSRKAENLCTFKCPECDKQCKDWQQLRRHLAIKHDTKGLSMTDLPSLASTIVCHACQICSAHLLCDLVFIRRHLTNQHSNMLIGQYIKKYYTDTTKATIKETYSQQVIGNLCAYACRVCGKKFHCRDTLHEHHSRELAHDVGPRVREELTKLVLHKCKLCNKSVHCDNEALGKHIRSLHSISLTEYCRRTGCAIIRNSKLNCSPLLASLELSNTIENKCEFVCSFCNNRYYNYTGFRIHLRSHQVKTSQPIASYLVKGYSYRCEICFLLTLCDKNIIASHMRLKHNIAITCKTLRHAERLEPEYLEFSETVTRHLPVSTKIYRSATISLDKLSIRETTSTFGDLCKFVCTKCNFQKFYSWEHLRKHSKKVHGQSIVLKPSSVLTARYHRCLICPKAIMADRYFLTIHLKQCHRKRLSEYEKVFSKNGGKTLPSLKEWVRAKIQAN